MLDKQGLVWNTNICSYTSLCESDVCDFVCIVNPNVERTQMITNIRQTNVRVKNENLFLYLILLNLEYCTVSHLIWYEEFSLFCTSFLFLFLLSNMSLKSFGTLSHANHSSGNSIIHLTLYFLAFPSFLFEYRIVCTTLSLVSYKQNGKWAHQWGHMKSKQEIDLSSLASFSCQNLLWRQISCCL